MWTSNDIRKSHGEEARGEESKAGTQKTLEAGIGGRPMGRLRGARAFARNYPSGGVRALPFLLTIALLLAAFGLVTSPRCQSAILGLYSVQEVKPNVFVWIPDDVIDQECDPLFTRPATAGFILTSEGVVVVDTSNSPMHARDLLYEIQRRTDQPIRYVINTSSAADHMLGNEVSAMNKPL